MLSNQFLSEKSCLYMGKDPQAFAEYLNQNFGPFAFRWRTPATVDVSIHYRQLDRIGFCRLRYGAPAGIATLGLSEVFLVQFILNGTAYYTIDGKQFEIAAGQVMVINPGHRIELDCSEDCEKFILGIPQTLFADVCRDQRWQYPVTGLHFLHGPYEASQLNGLRDLVALMCSEAESPGATPPMLQHYNWIVTAKMFDVLSHIIAMETPGLPSSAFERLVAYINDNLKDEITLEDLAKHANISPRSVYMLFEKYAKKPPKSYIRQKKLEAVYTDLMDPACRVANVTAVALEYGFKHLGRFSEFYKKTFGVMPSDSLRERQVEPCLVQREVNRRD